MDEGLKQEADRRFEEALQESGARDPREFYRTALRELREQPDLRELLDSRYALLAESPHYRIYDLRSARRR